MLDAKASYVLCRWAPVPSRAAVPPQGDHNAHPLLAKLVDEHPDLVPGSDALTPMGRRGHPEEIARVALFLAGDEASFVTGTIYAADGGMTSW